MYVVKVGAMGAEKMVHLSTFAGMDFHATARRAIVDHQHLNDANVIAAFTLAGIAHNAMLSSPTMTSIEVSNTTVSIRIERM
jgi:hypothetical protein